MRGNEGEVKQLEEQVEQPETTTAAAAEGASSELAEAESKADKNNSLTALLVGVGGDVPTTTAKGLDVNHSHNHQEKVQQYLRCASAPRDTTPSPNNENPVKVEGCGERRAACNADDQLEDDEEDHLRLLQQKELGKAAGAQADTPAVDNPTTVGISINPTADTDAAVDRILQPQIQTLPTANIRGGDTGGRPGAYSSHPGGESFLLQPSSAAALMSSNMSMTARTVSTQSNTIATANNNSNINSNSSDHQGLVEARPVSDEEDPPRAVAQEERISSNAEPSELPCWRPYRCALLGSAAFVAFMVLILFLSGVFDSKNSSDAADVALQPSTQNSTVSPASLYVQSFLPQSTLDALQLPESSQAKALKWLQDDPQVLLYPEERIKQRFALATFYFATNGRRWVNHKDWLSYELHECQWAVMTGYSGLLALPIFESELPPCDEAFYEGLADTNSDEEPGLYRHVNSTTEAFKRLWMKQNNLAGSLPEELFWLSSLQSLNVMDNYNLTGTIPTSFGSLSDLEDLTLTEADFTGKLGIEGYHVLVCVV